MTAFPWPAWVSWLMLIAVLLTLIIAWSVLNALAAVRYNLADAGVGRARMPARSRKELEDRYVMGSVDREVYERWKDRLR